MESEGRQQRHNHNIKNVNTGNVRRARWIARALLARAGCRDVTAASRDANDPVSIRSATALAPIGRQRLEHHDNRASRSRVTHPVSFSKHTVLLLGGYGRAVGNTQCRLSSSASLFPGPWPHTCPNADIIILYFVASTLKLMLHSFSHAVEHRKSTTETSTWVSPPN
jgi:hypothetical protein